MTDKKIYSHHHFMFPFRWDVLPVDFSISKIKENISFDERTDLNHIPDKFDNWYRVKYRLCNTDNKLKYQNYNEFTYFHEFIQKAVFDYDYPWKKEQEIIKYYEYSLDPNFTNEYSIEFIKNNTLQTLVLDLDGITLHFYSTGVGVLTYNLTNSKINQSDASSILKINEFGRRTYPQFMSSNGTKAVKEKFLANKIVLTVNGKPITEDFSCFDDQQSFLSPFEPYRLPEFITGLFKAKFIFRMTNTELDEEKILITKVTDDRMFFHSWYGNNEISNLISEEYKKEGKISNDWYYAYLFGDKDYPTIANKRMQLKQTELHSYTRWIEMGTVYGMSRDSFVSVTDTGDFSCNLLRVHMQTIYYTISVLCLAQKASILKFTAEVANLADLAKVQQNKQLVNNIKEVYKNYIEFINKLYFREITSQIQGIEIYNQFQTILNMDKEIDDLDNEISELHDYVSLLQDSKRNEEAAKLNKLAMIFLPATLLFGLLGANLYDGNKEFMPRFFSLNTLFWVIVAFIPTIVYYFYLKLFKR